MELFNLRNVNGRNKRRKQAQAGRFKKDHLSSKENETEYDIPIVSPSELKKVKEEIRTKIKKQNRKNLLLAILLSSVIIYLFYYLLR